MSKLLYVFLVILFLGACIKEPKVVDDTITLEGDLINELNGERIVGVPGYSGVAFSIGLPGQSPKRVASSVIEGGHYRLLLNYPDRKSEEIGYVSLIANQYSSVDYYNKTYTLSLSNKINFYYAATCFSNLYREIVYQSAPKGDSMTYLITNSRDTIAGKNTSYNDVHYLSFPLRGAEKNYINYKSYRNGVFTQRLETLTVDCHKWISDKFYY